MPGPFEETRSHDRYFNSFNKAPQGKQLSSAMLHDISSRKALLSRLRSEVCVSLEMRDPK